MENTNDRHLWQIAKRRTEFKKSLTAYFLVNFFLCAIWFITSGRHGGNFWPIWPMLGWGIGLAFQYVNAYTKVDNFSATKEYEKLKKEQEGRS